jgi:hypothetical protein
VNVYVGYRLYLDMRGLFMIEVQVSLNDNVRNTGSNFDTTKLYRVNSMNKYIITITHMFRGSTSSLQSLVLAQLFAVQPFPSWMGTRWQGYYVLSQSSRSAPFFWQVYLESHDSSTSVPRLRLLP